MPIVNTITQATTNADGSKQVLVRNYDQDGGEYTFSFYAPVGFDYDTAILNKVAELNIQLAEAEFEAMIGAG